MIVLTVSHKGQITLKKELLQHLGIQAGQRIAIDKLPNGNLQLQAERATGTINDFIGRHAGKVKRPISIEEMNEAIEQGWAGE